MHLHHRNVAHAKQLVLENDATGAVCETSRQGGGADQACVPAASPLSQGAWRKESAAPGRAA